MIGCQSTVLRRLVYVQRSFTCFLFSFVCPELALYGEWSHFQAFLVNYARTRSSSISSTPDIAGSTPLPMVDLPSLHAMIQQRWNDAQPVESLSGQDFKELLKQFSLSRELQPQDFAFHQVKRQYPLDGYIIN